MSSIKAAFKYQLTNDYKKSIICYYIIVFLFFSIVSVVFVSFSGSSSRSTVGSPEAATLIFLFILGLCCFKSNFLMMIQNGVSRKSIFIARLQVTVTVSIIMTVVDTIFSIIIGLYAGIRNNFIHESMYMQLYPQRYTKIGTVQYYFESILLCFCLYAALSALGYFITIMYYRLNKLGKIIVSISAAIFVSLVTSIDNIVANKLSNFIYYISGLEKQNPFIFIVSTIFVFAAFSFFGWMLMRKASVKE